MLRTLYLDTALWNRLFECGVDPCLLTHALEQNRWELAISPHVMYELAKSFRGKRTESQKKAVPLFSYVKEFLDLRIACVKQVPDLGYRSFTEQYFDSCGIFRDAVIAIIATVAKQERIRISERVKAGLETARAKGKRLGRPRVILDARRIGILRAQGLSWAKIAAQLGVGRGNRLPTGTRIRQKPDRRRARKSLCGSSRLRIFPPAKIKCLWRPWDYTGRCEEAIRMIYFARPIPSRHARTA